MKKLLLCASAALLLLLPTTSVALAGAVGGPKCTDETVLARSTDCYNICFRANEEAIVIARGDGDIDILVYDENNNLITQDTKTDHVPVVRWTPKWTGMFRIEVRNCESFDVDYRIGTN